MTNEKIAFLLVGLGILLPLAGWAFFRKPGYDFFTFAPVTKAHEYMERPGAILWWVGIVVLLVGVFRSWSLPA